MSTREPGSLITKDPSAIEPYGFDYTAWLAELGVTISTSTWAVTGADSVLTLSTPTIVGSSLKTQVYLNAGTLGLTYTVTNHIVTTGSPAATDERSFFVLIEQR